MQHIVPVSLDDAVEKSIFHITCKYMISIICTFLMMRGVSLALAVLLCCALNSFLDQKTQTY